MMKRMMLSVMAVMLLCGMFSGCSGSVYYDDPMPYGNVSTTNDGRVNGTNRCMEPGVPGERTRPTPQSGARAGSDNGTGMTGGR